MTTGTPLQRKEVFLELHVLVSAHAGIYKALQRRLFDIALIGWMDVLLPRLPRFP